MTGIGRQFGVISDRPHASQRWSAARPLGGASAMFTLAHLSDPHLPMPQARVARSDRQARDRLLQLVAQPRATPRARGAGRHRGRHQGAEARPHRADRRPREHLAARRIRPRLRSGSASFGTPERITVIPGNHDVYVATAWREGLGQWGAYMAGDGQPPATDFKVLSDRAPARAGRAGRPATAACRSRRCSRPARSAMRRSPPPRSCWRISAARGSAAS